MLEAAFAEHVEQLEDIMEGEYPPADQFVHVAEKLAPTSGEDKPAGQGVQNAEPLAVEYDPAGQMVQNEEEGPTLHPTGQIEHVSE